MQVRKSFQALALSGLIAPAVTGCGSSTPAMASTARASSDNNAKSAVAKALKVAAIEYQNNGDYTFVIPDVLRNVAPRLRTVSALDASGSGSTFTISVRSASGTTFGVQGNGLALSRTCTPAGPDCLQGHWPGVATLQLPKVPVVTTATKTKVRAILTASVDHYAQLFARGEQILGPDPNVPVDPFANYQGRVQLDFSYLRAGKQASSYYTPANYPKALANWDTDIAAAQIDMYQWTAVASMWQYGERTTAQLDAAESRVTSALAMARRDIAAGTTS